MIGDPTGALTRNIDNMREDEGLADRATFVVAPQGIIQAIEVTAEGMGRDASDLQRKIKPAQYVALKVWLTVRPSLLTRRVSSRQSKLPLKALAVTRLTCCVKSKQHST